MTVVPQGLSATINKICRHEPRPNCGHEENRDEAQRVASAVSVLGTRAHHADRTPNG
jgi:hypothetical protein